MIPGFFNIPWFGWAVVALVIAVINAFIWPHTAVTAPSGFRFFVLRWGHALTWMLLSINFHLRGISPSLNSAATLVALAGGIMYLLFIYMAYVVKR